MLIAFLLYFLMGLAIACYIALRQGQPREKAIGEWMMILGGAPVYFLAMFLFWPLWVLLMALPQETFIEPVKKQEEETRSDHVGKVAKVVIPLNPVGRVSVDGDLRDARSECGSVPVGAKVVVRACTVGDELLVRLANQSSEVTAKAAPPL